MTDTELVKLCLDKDKEYFREIVERYQAPIQRYAMRLLNFHQEDAEDVLSQTFLKAYTNLAGYNPKLKFSSWLYRIAHNEAVNLIRKKSKASITDLEKASHLGEKIDFDKPSKEDLEKILGGLKVDHRNILTLFYLEERTIKEISETLKISEGSVKVRLNRARNSAKKLVK